MLEQTNRVIEDRGHMYPSEKARIKAISKLIQL